MARAHDCLEWECFLEGYISILLIKLVWPWLHYQSPRKSLDKRDVEFIKALTAITHKQWIFQNADAHHVLDGLIFRQHTALFAHVHELMLMPRSCLLPCHWHLLDQDFHGLGNSDTHPRQMWVALMESTLSAATHVTLGHHTHSSLRLFYTPVMPGIPSPLIHSLPTPAQRYRPPPFHRPQQATHPATFWRPTHTSTHLSPVPQDHQIDLSSTHNPFCWRRKWALTRPGQTCLLPISGQEMTKQLTFYCHSVVALPMMDEIHCTSNLEKQLINFIR